MNKFLFVFLSQLEVFFVFGWFLHGLISDWGELTELYLNNINHSIAGIDFSRHNVTSMDVTLWRLESIPALKEWNIYNGRRPIT